MASELCKEPVKFVRFIMLLFSLQALPDFKAEEAKVLSEVGVAGFFHHIQTHQQQRLYNFFFLFFKQNL